MLKTNVLDEICFEAGAKPSPDSWLYNCGIEMVSGNAPPFLQRDCTTVVVGEKWLTGEQWAELIALRLRGDVKFNRDDSGRLFIREKPCMGGFVNTFSHIGVSAKQAASCLNKFSNICSNFGGIVNGGNPIPVEGGEAILPLTKNKKGHI